MGLTPLEGLVMGTRCGDIDTALLFYMQRKAGLTYKQMDKILNDDSGLVGLCGQADRRDIQDAVAKGDKMAALAQDVETLRVKKYIGGYMAALGHVDALVFTAGVGEHAWFMRKKYLDGLEPLGILYDEKKNRLSVSGNAETCISTPDSKIPIFVIPTDEELVITEDTWALVNGTYDVHTKYHYIFQDKDYVNKSRAESLKRELVQTPELAGAIAHPK
jgi:acetate kinase